MKLLFITAIICLSCSKNNNFITFPSNQDKIIGRTWKTYEFSHNGTVLSAVANQEPTFEFRSDSKIYFSQINPVARDTIQFIFINETNIQLTKPWINLTDVSNLKVDSISDNDFNFTITNNKSSDIDSYKTHKQ